MKAIPIDKRCALYGALPLVAVLASAPASAAPWEFIPSVEAGLMFDDNYRLTPPVRRSTCRVPWWMRRSKCAR